MPVAWHPIRWCNWCLSEDETKEIEPISAYENYYKVADIFSTKINSIINCQLLNSAVT